MKKTLLLFAMLLSVIAASAKDIKTVVFTTNPIMHCANCENKIKTNLRFVKGVKDILTNVSEQRVTVSYDADKTSSETLQKAFTKFGYEAKVVGCDGTKAKCESGNAGCQGTKPSCCKEKKEESSCCKAAAGTKPSCCKEKKNESSCCKAAAEKSESCGSCNGK